MIMEIRLDMKTPTINHLYWHRGNIKIMKTEAKKLREEIRKEVIKSLPFVCHNINNGLRVSVDIHEDWFCKNGSVKRKDVANREKFLIDSVFNALEIDDKFIFEHNIRKIQDSKEFTIIKIEALNDSFMS